MIAIHTKANIGADGMLVVQVPTALRNTDVEVIVILQPIEDGRAEGAVAVDHSIEQQADRKAGQ